MDPVRGASMDAEGSTVGVEGWGLHVQVRVPLDAIDLDVDWRPKSDHVAILGPSGSGKSTLLRALAGLEPGAEGRVRFGDEVWLDSDSEVNMPAWERRVGWVPQDTLLFPHLSLRENLAYAGAGLSEVESMAESLFLSDLLDRRPPVSLRRGTPEGGVRPGSSLGPTGAASRRAVLGPRPAASFGDRRHGTRVRP